jgi:hypothetical protein
MAAMEYLNTVKIFHLKINRLLGSRYKLVDSPFVIEHIDLAHIVFPERRDSRIGFEDPRFASHPFALGRANRKNFAAAIVPIEIGAHERRDRSPPVHITSDDRTTAALMAILNYRGSKIFLLTKLLKIKAMKPLHDPPAVISALPHDIDFLPSVLSDIGQPKIPGFSIKRKTPGISQPLGEDFRPFLASYKWVVSGNAIGSTTIHVDPK